MINGGWKTYYGLENNCKAVDLWIWDKLNNMEDKRLPKIDSNSIHNHL
jgi:hypothetical protein